MKRIGGVSGGRGALRRQGHGFAARLRYKPWTIEGPFAPGEMPVEMQKQWDELKRTGIGPGHPDF